MASNEYGELDKPNKWDKMIEAGKATRFVSGLPPWNKGTKGVMHNPLKGKQMSLEWREKLSLAKKGKPIPHLHNEEVRKKIGDAQRGEKHYNWKGGVVSEADRLRRTKEGKAWKLAVKLRDGYKCVQCGSKEQLQIDHIKPFSTHPELRVAIDNGRTLCFECHKLTDSYGGKQTYKNRQINYGK